jgi:DNA-binding transcriptional regulator GbsR (MarR family)
VLNEQNTKPRRNTARPAAEDAFIEQMGVIMSADGLPRIGGRLLGLLLITDGDASLDDIARRLRVSKPSISTNARLLEQRGVIEKVSRAADRRDYYRIADDVFTRTMQQKLLRIQRLQACIDTARAGLPQAPARVGARVDDFAAACVHVAGLTEEALRKLGTTGSARARR